LECPGDSEPKFSNMDGEDEALVMMYRHLLQASIDTLEAERFKIKSIDNRILACGYQNMTKNGMK